MDWAHYLHFIGAAKSISEATRLIKQGAVHVFHSCSICGGTTDLNHFSIPDTTVEDYVCTTCANNLNLPGIKTEIQQEEKVIEPKIKGPLRGDLVRVGKLFWGKVQTVDNTHK